METVAPQFDPIKYKNTTRDQWQTAAEAWYRWSPTLKQWLGNATDKMLEMAGISAGHRVLDVAAGAGESSSGDGAVTLQVLCTSGAQRGSDILAAAFFCNGTCW